MKFENCIILLIMLFDQVDLFSSNQNHSKDSLFYIITRGEISVNTQYFLEHLIFSAKKPTTVVLKVEVQGPKGSFSLKSMQPIKDTNPKKLNIQTLPMTHTIRKHRRFRL